MSHTNATQNPMQRIDELEGLRGILAIWVAVAHMACWAGYWEITAAVPLQRLWEEFVSATAAVEVFIILSGFAISFLIHNRPQSYGDYLRGRIIRIYPVYIVCLVIGFSSSKATQFVLEAAQWRDNIYFDCNRVIHYHESQSLGWHTFWHVILLNGVVPKAWLPDATATLLAPAWSTSLEWQYYLLAPLIARLVQSQLGLMALTLAAWLGHRYGHLWLNPHLAFLPTQLPLFLMGIGSYHIHHQLMQSHNNSRRSTTIVMAFLVASILMKWHTIALLIWGIAFGSVLVRGDRSALPVFSLVRWVLCHTWLQFLGRISYPLYLVHWPIILTLLSVIISSFPQVTALQVSLVLVLVGLPITIIIAYGLHRIVERPMMAFGKRTRLSEK